MDEAAFTAFYNAHHRALWGYLYRLSDHPDDLLQEAFIRYLEHPPRGDTAGEQRAYLFQIATRLAYDVRRTKTRAYMKWLTDWTATEVNETAAPHLDLSLHMDLDTLFDQLTPRERSLLWLAYAERYTHAEIADILGLRPKSIRVLLHRARKRFTALLNQTDLAP